MKKQLILLLLSVLAIAITSCKTPQNVVYLQDLTPEHPVAEPTVDYIKIKSRDKLRINVHCRDEAIANLFNVNSRSMGYGNSNYGGSSGSSLDLYSYNVDEDGNIDFPVVGKIQVKGLTRQQAADRIREILVEQNLIKDPYISVAFATSYFYTIGEFGTSGQKQITKDAFTIIEALAQSGDIAITGERENVQVIREVNGQLQTYVMDFTSAEALTSSPAYYIQPGDIIYALPNKNKIFETTAIGKSVRTPAFWMSTISTVISLSLTIYALKDKF